MRCFHGALGALVASSSLVSAGASAQSQGCGVGATCESASPVVARAAQDAREPSQGVTFTLSGNVGVGTPYGVLGLALAVAPARWLALEAGLGVNPDQGAEAGFLPRFRLPVSADTYLTLGSGVSWAHRYVGHADLVGELVADHRVALPAWSPAYFWDRNLDPSKNPRLTVPSPAKRAEPRPQKLAEVPRIVAVLERARTWQGMLDRREVRTQAELAMRAGLCAVYVGNILGLLRLHPAILERIERLEPGGAGAEVTERWLRPISKLPHDEQLAAVAERLPMAGPEEVA